MILNLQHHASSPQGPPRYNCLDKFATVSLQARQNEYLPLDQPVFRKVRF